MSTNEDILTNLLDEEVDLHAMHTEVGEHEYTIDELKAELEEAKKASQEN